MTAIALAAPRRVFRDFVVGLTLTLFAAVAAANPLPSKRPELGTFVLDLLTGIMLAVTHSDTVKQTVADAVVDLIDGGAGAGNLVFRTSGDVEVATCAFSDPAFGNSNSTGLATANAISDDTNATGGTIAKFTAEDSDAATVFTGSVTATGGGGDITLSSLAPSSGDTVGVDSLTYQSMP